MLENLKFIFQLFIIPVLVWVILIERRLSGLEATLDIIKKIVLNGGCDKE
jgi:hypothetical protein